LQKEYITKLFIVDNSDIIREHLIALLEKIDGIEIVGEAKDSDKAIQSIKEVRPDVAILDIKMPGDGINALKVIKGKKYAPIVIMFTNYPYPEFREKCFELGADYFFDKSGEFEKFIKVLKQLVPVKNKNPIFKDKHK